MIDWLAMWCMPTDDCFLPLDLPRVEMSAFPEENLVVIPADILDDGELGAQAGMDEYEVFRLVVQPGVVDKVDVMIRDLDLPITRAIAAQRVEPAVHAPDLELTSLEVVQHKGFVIAAEECTLHVVVELQEDVDHSSGIGSAIDIVTDEYQVIFLLRRNFFDQCEERFRTSMDISNRNETHGPISASSEAG